VENDSAFDLPLHENESRALIERKKLSAIRLVLTLATMGQSTNGGSIFKNLKET